MRNQNLQKKTDEAIEMAKAKAFMQAMSLSNLMIVAPTIRKFANRYTIDSFIDSYDNKNHRKVSRSGMNMRKTAFSPNGIKPNLSRTAENILLQSSI